MAPRQKVAPQKVRQGAGPDILVINPGSTSRKYAVARGGEVLLRGSYELTPTGAAVTFEDTEAVEEHDFERTEFAHTTDHFIAFARDHGLLQGSLAVGLRIVAPGTYFQKHRLIDAGFMTLLKHQLRVAPLHIKPEIHEIEHLRRVLPRAALYGISDTAFHATIPPAARTYAIDRDDAKDFDIYRFGYHGISVASVLHRLPDVLGRLPQRLAVCHLGGGASITAVRDGQSIDTSMGFSPLEGLVMASRVGDIDPGALIELKKRRGMSVPQLETYLNHRGGLKGLSGGEDDLRALIGRAKQGDEPAELALDVWTYRIVKYLGAYAAVLGGLETIVFTATVGERSDYLRARILKGLGTQIVRLDVDANQRVSKRDGLLTTGASPVTAVVIRTDELAEIARQTAKLV